MCGRFSLTQELEEVEHYLSEEFQIYPPLEVTLPRYNIAPTQNVLSIIYDGNQYRAGTLKWGLIPPFAKDEKIGSRLINARAETIAEKPSFKHSFYHRRCLILADSFYEWKKTDKEKIPYRIYLKDQELFTFAGLWSMYTRPTGEKIFTCTIITTAANEVMAPIHHRMPVILSKENQKRWLDPAIRQREELEALLSPYSTTQFDLYPISNQVNFVRNDHPGIIEPIEIG